MESIEGHHAENISSPLRISSMEDMNSWSTVAAIDELPKIKDSLFHPHYPITWIESDDLLTEQNLWVANTP